MTTRSTHKPSLSDLAVNGSATLARKDAWNRAMTASPGTLDLEVGAKGMKGTIPSALRGGTYLANGPGWADFGGWVAHPFDGHGYLRALHFDDDGGVTLQGRFVETDVYRLEVGGTRLRRRGLATNVGPHFWQNIGFGPARNVANTTIVARGDRLLAGWEGGAPHAVDAATLSTIGEETFDGAIAGQATLAHMHLDAQRDRLILCSVKIGPTVKLTFRELDADNEVVSEVAHTVPGPIFAHDFAFTSSAYVVAGNMMKFRVGELLKMGLGASTLLRCLRPDVDAPGALHIIPRDGSAPRMVTLPSSIFVVHFGNAFERADGTVVVDVCAFTHPSPAGDDRGGFSFGEEFGYTGPATPLDPSLPDTRAPQRLYRVEVPPGSTSATWTQLTPYGVDFPRIHPRGEGRDVPVLFGACRADPAFSDPFDAIVRVDLRAIGANGAAHTLWTPGGTSTFVGEPIFVPAPTSSIAGNSTGSHDDDVEAVAGHLLVMVTDGEVQCSRLVVLDAEKIERGPVAEVPLPLLPIAFHGDWRPRS